MHAAEKLVVLDHLAHDFAIGERELLKDLKAGWGGKVARQGTQDDRYDDAQMPKRAKLLLAE